MTHARGNARRMAVIYRFPALAALLIQLAALAALSAVSAIPGGGMTPYAGWPAAALQGGLAAALAWRLGQERWWLWIHAGFPLAVVAVRHAQLPDWFFLTGFLFFLALFWTTFRTRVPFYPSGQKVWSAVLAELPQRPVRIIDVGSGTGGMIFHLARMRPDCACIGVETAPLPWLFSRAKRAAYRIRCELRWGRYEDINFSEFDVVFAYLSPAAMPDLWKKARAEMRPGTQLLSFEFPVPGEIPSRSVEVAGKSAYLYRFDM